MATKKISAGQRDILEDVRLRTSDAEVFRNVTIVLMAGKGRSHAAIADDLGCTPASVAQVLKTYQEQLKVNSRPLPEQKAASDGLILNITNRCNFRCKTCLRGKASAEDMPIPMLANFLRQAKALGVRSTVLTGGESILHPDFDKVLFLHAELGIRFGIVNNGWFYKEYSQALAPVKGNVRFVAFSLDGHTAAVNDAIRHRGSFKRVMAAIKHFLAEGYSVRVSHIVNRKNAEHVVKFMKLMRDYDVRVNIGFAIANQTNRAMQLQEKQIPKLRTELRALSSAYREKVMTGSSAGLCQDLVFCPSCTSMHSMTLQFDGKVMFCCDLLRDAHAGILGDITQEPLSEIMPRYGRVVGRLLEARIRSMSQGRSNCDNNCDFCNKILSEELCEHC